jgi:hypothetical protein
VSFSKDPEKSSIAYSSTGTENAIDFIWGATYVVGAVASPEGADITNIHNGIDVPMVAFAGFVKLQRGGLCKSTGNPVDVITRASNKIQQD